MGRGLLAMEESIWVGATFPALLRVCFFGFYTCPSASSRSFMCLLRLSCPQLCVIGNVTRSCSGDTGRGGHGGTVDSSWKDHREWPEAMCTPGSTTD